MNQIYYCPNCKNVYIGDGSANPTNACSCGGTLIGTGISAGVWENLSDAEKNASLASLNGNPVFIQASTPQISQFMADYYNMCKQFFSEVSHQMEKLRQYQENIYHDLHVFYVIFIIEFILSIIAGISILSLVL